MKKTVRLNDLSFGHGCFAPRPSIAGSSNVFINLRNTHRVGDAWVVHTCGSSHAGTTVVGSTNVFVNGLSLARENDAISCGDKCSQGSTNVYCNSL